MKTSSLLTAAALCTAPAFAQADECSAATDLGVGPTSIAFDTNMAVDTGTLATTSAEQQCFSLTDDVWFRWTAAATGDAQFDTCNNATFDTEIAVWEGSDCVSLVPLGCNDDNGAAGCTNLTSLIVVPVTAGQVYYVQLGHWNGTDGDGFGAGTLTIAPFVDPCIGSTDDAFEDNDTCPSPTAITPGTYPGLFVNDVDPDFYSIVVPAGDELDVTAIDTGVDVDFRQFDAGCALITDFNTDGFVYLNQSGAPETVIFEVYWDPTNAGGNCTDYDLTIEVTTPVPPPTCTQPDVFEPNLDCTSAVALGSGTYTGLNVTDVDQDYYSVNVAAGDTLDVSILFEDDFSDLDLYIWDPLVNCDSNVAGNNSPDALDVGFSTTDDEDVTYTNLTGADQSLIIEVDVFDGSTCNDYDLIITGASDGTLGVPFCQPGNVNSTGVAGIAGAEGTSSVSANDVTLTASSLPPGQFGIFVTSITQVPGVPVGDGLLCLGGQIGRYQGLNEIFQADPNGDGSLVIDLTAIPTPSALVQAMPGETRSFQAWHRDVNASGPTSNFTEGIAITFTP